MMTPRDGMGLSGPFPMGNASAGRPMPSAPIASLRVGAFGSSLATITHMDAMDQAIAAQAACKERRAHLAALRKAVALYERAHEYPRCGQGWPVTNREMDAAALIDCSGGITATAQAVWEAI